MGASNQAVLILATACRSALPGYPPLMTGIVAIGIELLAKFGLIFDKYHSPLFIRLALLFSRGVAGKNAADLLCVTGCFVMNKNSDNKPDEAINPPIPAQVVLALGDIFIQSEESLFIDDSSKLLLINGTSGERVNLSDLLPAGPDPGEWMKARGSVTVEGVQYEVYHHPSIETELLVQVGLQVASLT